METQIPENLSPSNAARYACRPAAAAASRLTCRQPDSYRASIVPSPSFNSMRVLMNCDQSDHVELPDKQAGLMLRHNHREFRIEQGQHGRKDDGQEYCDEIR